MPAVSAAKPAAIESGGILRCPLLERAGLCMQLAAEPRSSDGRRSLTASLAAPGLLRGAESNVFLDTFFLDGECIHGLSSWRF